MKKYVWFLVLEEGNDCLREECDDPDLAEDIYGNEGSVGLFVVGEHEKFNDNCVEVIIDDCEVKFFKEPDGTLYNYGQYFSKEEMITLFDKLAESDPIV